MGRAQTSVNERLSALQSTDSAAVSAASAGVAHFGRAHVPAAEVLMSTTKVLRSLVGVRRRALAAVGLWLAAAEGAESAGALVPGHGVSVVLIRAIRISTGVVRLRSAIRV